MYQSLYRGKDGEWYNFQQAKTKCKLHIHPALPSCVVCTHRKLIFVSEEKYRVEVEILLAREIWNRGYKEIPMFPCHTLFWAPVDAIEIIPDDAPPLCGTHREFKFT